MNGGKPAEREVNMKVKNSEKSVNNTSDWTWKQFFRRKYILLISLVFAILSILMDQEIIRVEPRVTNAFTIAAAVGVVMYLLKESFSRKAERYRATLERMKEMEAEEAAQADRLLVMDAGRIALEGAPREVFRRVDEVRALGLDVPEMTRLAKRLRDAGLEVSPEIMTVEEMAVELCRLK